MRRKESATPKNSPQTKDNNIIGNIIAKSSISSYHASIIPAKPEVNFIKAKSTLTGVESLRKEYQ